MNCQDCQELLQEYLDGLAPGLNEGIPAGFDEHLHACADCRDLYQAARRLDEGLNLLTSPVPPVGLLAQVVAEALRERRARRTLRRVVNGVLAVAATFLLTFGIYETSHRPQTIAQGANAPRSEPPPEQDPGPLPEPMNEVRSLVQDLANETVNETRQMLPEVKAPSLGGLDLSPPLEPPARSLREATETVSTGLEPVADSARRALGLFLRDLPPMESTDKPGL
jgi:hypothetical protein